MAYNSRHTGAVIDNAVTAVVQNEDKWNDNIVPFVSGTQTSATGSFTGNAPTVDALYNGLTIRYWLPYAGSGNATLNLTLKSGATTGAKEIYFRGTTRLATQYPAGSLILLTYLENATISGAKYSGWWCSADYYVANTDTKNTAGATNTSSKLFIIGATSQGANPRTYSHDTAYIGTDGCLYSGGIKVASKVMYTATIGTSWTTNSSGGYKQTVTVSGIKSTDTPVIGVVQTTSVATSQTLLENWALVSRITTANNSITAYCYGDKPTVSLPIQIICTR